MHTVQLKPTIKAQISGRMASIGLSDVVTASVYFEKTRLKMMISYEEIARNDGFSRAPEIDFHYETKARKVMVDFKFVALYRYVSIESEGSDTIQIGVRYFEIQLDFVDFWFLIGFPDFRADFRISGFRL